MPDDRKSIELASEPVEEVRYAKCGCEIDVAGLEPFLRVECPDCAHVEIVPVKFANFLLLDLVGTGGMGGVYAARDEALGRLVAIKVMLKSLGDDQAFVDGFKKEAQAVAKLNHPHIAQIYSFGQVHGQPYIVMELVPGERLDKMIESDRPIEQGLVMRIGMEVAEGLAAAEEADLIHGDIKPENVLLDEKMHAKLVDFGLASYVNQSAADGIWGTPYYIAPEKVKRQQADSRSDMYSLGATLYHALAGRPPFEGDSPVDVVKARLKAPARPIHDCRPKVDEQAEAIVMRMLEAHPAKRHPTYASLISDLRKSSTALLGKRRGRGRGGPKTRRMVVPKKKTGAHTSVQSPSRAAAPAPPPPAPAPAARERPRTTIRRRKGGTIKTRRQGGTKVRVAKTKAAAAPVEPPPEEEAPSPSATLASYRNRNLGRGGRQKQQQAADDGGRKKKKKGAGGWIAGIFFTILAIGAVVGFFYWRHQEKIRLRTAAYLMRKAKKDSKEDFENLEKVIKSVAKLEASAQDYVRRATNALYIVTGGGFSARRAAAAVVPETNAVRRAAAPAGPPAGAAQPRPTPPRRPAGPPRGADDDVPDGIMTREQLDAMRRKR